MKVMGWKVLGYINLYDSLSIYEFNELGYNKLYPPFELNFWNDMRQYVQLNKFKIFEFINETEEKNQRPYYYYGFCYALEDGTTKIDRKYKIRSILPFLNLMKHYENV